MSPFWQWVFVFIGLVAFVMAAPFVLQLIFGQPTVDLVFDYDDTGGEGGLLEVHLSNPPINNPLLKAQTH